MASSFCRAELRTSLIGDDRLQALAARRRQLVEALQAERCRLDAAALPAVRASLEAVIAVLRQSLDTDSPYIDLVIHGSVEQWRTSIPLGHLADPADQGAVAAFLMSDGARHITGQVITVDGGQTFY